MTLGKGLLRQIGTGGKPHIFRGHGLQVETRVKDRELKRKMGKGHGAPCRGSFFQRASSGASRIPWLSG